MINLIDPTDLLKRLAEDHTPIVVDVRGADEYAAGQPIVTYCMPQALSVMKHRGESRGERAADLLRGKGYYAHVLNRGLPAWQEADESVLANSAAGAMQHMNEDHRANIPPRHCQTRPTRAPAPAKDK